MPTKGKEDRGASQVRGGKGPPSAAILDSAFRRAYRVSPRGKSRVERSHRRALLKIVRSSATVLRMLRATEATFRRSPLSEFERSLIDRRFGGGRLTRSILRVRTAQERIRSLSTDAQRRLTGLGDAPELAGAVRAFYGRLASTVREIDPDLEFLRSVERFRKERPQLDPLEPTVVIAGFPNVGKSSLVARLSSARPKIADYPFTTRTIAVGHTDFGFDRVQMLDTPGLLGRIDLNVAEVEADTALRKAATAVLFLLDPTGSSGYPIEEQEALLARWHQELPQLPILEVETKRDILRRRNRRLAVSAKTGEGLDELRARLEVLLQHRRSTEEISSDP